MYPTSKHCESKVVQQQFHRENTLKSVVLGVNVESAVNVNCYVNYCDCCEREDYEELFVGDEQVLIVTACLLHREQRFGALELLLLVACETELQPFYAALALIPLQHKLT